MKTKSLIAVISILVVGASAIIILTQEKNHVPVENTSVSSSTESTPEPTASPEPTPQPTPLAGGNLVEDSAQVPEQEAKPAPPPVTEESNEDLSDEQFIFQSSYDMLIEMGFSPEEAKQAAEQNVAEWKVEEAERQARREENEAKYKAQREAESAKIDAEYIEKYGHTFDDFNKLTMEERGNLISAYAERMRNGG